MRQGGQIPIARLRAAAGLPVGFTGSELVADLGYLAGGDVGQRIAADAVLPPQQQRLGLGRVLVVILKRQIVWSM